MHGSGLWATARELHLSERAMRQELMTPHLLVESDSNKAQTQAVRRTGPT
jgi:hypothetical protein